MYVKIVFDSQKDAIIMPRSIDVAQFPQGDHSVSPDRFHGYLYPPQPTPSQTDKKSSDSGVSSCCCMLGAEGESEVSASSLQYVMRHRAAL